MARLCKFADCGGQVRARNMCHKHYLQWLRPVLIKRKKAGIVVPRNSREIILGSLPGANVDVMKSTGLCLRTVQKWVRQLRSENLAHIGDWRHPKVTGDFVPIYHPGPGPDVPCTLVPYSHCNKLVWERRKARMTKEQRDDLRRKARTGKQVKAAAKRGDYLVNALFGPRKPSTETGEQQP
jgi:hypothetical protein